MRRTVLITGATGFGGSFLAEKYVRDGFDVHGTHRGPLPEGAPVTSEIELHEVDLRDAGKVEALLAAVRPDTVHHLAAQSSVVVSWQDPLGTLTANAAMQFHLLQALVTLDQPVRVVVAGSCDEYGYVEPEDNPVSEAHPVRPSNPYALSKVAQDLMTPQYAETALQIVTVRPFLQLGPRRDDRFVAGSFARQVAQIERGVREPVVDTGDIDVERDFTDVRDVVIAYALAAECGTPGQVYNIATGEAHSLRQMLMCMLDGVGVRAEIKINPAKQRGREMPRLVGDASRLRADTGWSPAISFEQSTMDTLNYWRGRVNAAP